jgi:hypothetical protein
LPVDACVRAERFAAQPRVDERPPHVLVEACLEGEIQTAFDLGAAPGVTGEEIDGSER